MVMEVLQRKTGRHLGSTTLEEIRGKCFVVAIRQLEGFRKRKGHGGINIYGMMSYTTTIKFRTGILYNASQSKDEQYLIAYGFRDAYLLPGFEPAFPSLYRRNQWKNLILK